MDLWVRGNFLGWEVPSFKVARFKKQGNPIDRSDALRWELGNNRSFSVNSFYEKLLVRTEFSFPHDLIWIPEVHRKVCFFA